MNVLNGARSVWWNEPPKSQIVKVDRMSGVLQRNSSADTNVITGSGTDSMELRYAMSADKPCGNTSGVASVAISKSVTDVGSTEFERLAGALGAGEQYSAALRTPIDDEGGYVVRRSKDGRGTYGERCVLPVRKVIWLVACALQPNPAVCFFETSLGGLTCLRVFASFFQHLLQLSASLFLQSAIGRKTID